MIARVLDSRMDEETHAYDREAVGSVAEEWRLSLARERLDGLYMYDALAIQI
jgi:hypothetical protein